MFKQDEFLIRMLYSQRHKEDDVLLTFIFAKKKVIRSFVLSSIN